MAQITSLYVRKVVARANASIETRDLVNGLISEWAGFVDSDQIGQSGDYYRFFAALAERDLSGLGLALWIGPSVPSAEHGALRQAWRNAPDLLVSCFRYSEAWRRSNDFE